MSSLRPIGSCMRRQSSKCIAQLETPRAESSRHAVRHLASSSVASYEAKFEDPALYQSERRMNAQIRKSKGHQKQNVILKAQRFAKALKRPAVAEAIKSAQTGARDDFMPMIQPSDANGEDRTPDSQVRDILESANKALDKWYDSRETLRFEEDGVYEEKEADFYRKQYELAHVRIGQALVVKQLKELAGFGKSSRAHKKMAIQKVMENLGWEVPVAKEEKKIVPTITRNFRLPENELFLFLRDTQTIHDFIVNNGVSFSVDDAIPLDGVDRQTLRATGPEESIGKLAKRIEERRKDMVVTTITSGSIHHYIPPAGLLKFVSDVTGTHIASVNGADYQVSATSSAKTRAVERCLQVAALRTHILPASRTSAMVTPPRSPEDDESASESSDNYSSYPYIPTPSMLIPWHDLVFSFAEPLHRLRRVGEWSTRAGKHEMEHRKQAIHEGDVYPVEAGEQGVTLELFASEAGVVPGAADRTTTLTFGQVLMRNGKDAPSNILTSPVPGQFPAVEARSRLQAVPDRIFSPSLTPAMLHQPLKNPPQQQRRLTYRSADGKAFMTCTYRWPIGSTDGALPELSESEELHENWLQKLDSLLEEEKGNSVGVSDEDGKGSPEAELATGNIDILGDLRKIHAARGAALRGAGETEADTSAPTSTDEEESVTEKLVVEKGSVAEVDLMLPDRPVDARLTTRSSSIVDDAAVPVPITEFFDRVVSAHANAEGEQGEAPEAPMSVTLDGETFLLEKDEQLHIVESTAGDDVILRAVHTKDMVLGVDRYVSHTELEYVGEKVPSMFWREMANTARDIPPVGTSLARGGFSF